MKMKSRILRCIHYLQTALIVKMKKPLKKNINFHISDQMNFQEFNNNILPVHSAPTIAQQQISNRFFLMWVSGTTVSKCYGCNGSVPNLRLTCWIMSLLLGNISFIIVMEIQDSYSSQGNHKMLILI